MRYFRLEEFLDFSREDDGLRKLGWGSGWGSWVGEVGTREKERVSDEIFRTKEKDKNVCRNRKR